MLESLLQNPIVTIGFFLFVLWLLATYYMNKERAAANRKRGRRKFQPDWSRRRTGSPDRRRPFSRRDRRFQPHWKRRSSGEAAGEGEEPGSAGEKPDSTAPLDRKQP